MVQFIWNIVPVVNFSALAGVGRTAPGFAVTAAVLDIWDILKFFDHDKCSIYLQLIEDNSKDLQNLLKYFNGTATFVSNVLLSACVLPVIFILNSNYLIAVQLLFIL